MTPELFTDKANEIIALLECAKLGLNPNEPDYVMAAQQLRAAAEMLPEIDGLTTNFPEDLRDPIILVEGSLRCVRTAVEQLEVVLDETPDDVERWLDDSGLKRLLSARVGIEVLLSLPEIAGIV